MPGLPEVFAPMLATLVAEPFDSPDYLFEVKWDGVRTLAFCESGETRLYSRSGREVSGTYPEFAGLHDRIGPLPAVVDAEIVAMDDGGRPSFELLQQRIGLSKPADVRRATASVPVELVAFDLVHRDGEWLGEAPLEDRLAALEAGMRFGDGVVRSQVVEGAGTALFGVARERRLEGIVGKRRGSRYQPGRRSKDWMKVKTVHSLQCVVGGWTHGQGGRSGTFGAILVGAYKGDALKFLGAVGTGFTDRYLDRMKALMSTRTSDECPFDSPPRGVKAGGWLRPEIVVEVEYREMTAAMRLRAPSFKGFREDLTPEDCVLEQAASGQG